MIAGLWSWIRRWLFRLDAETAHRMTVTLIRGTHRISGNSVLGWISGSAGSQSASRTQVWDMEFASKLGLAAGFDKDAELVSALPALGFGFVEVGTVTPRPQSGNERPRLFRDSAQRSLFNRMGFNGQGAKVVAQRLSEARSGLPPGFRVGVNVGKNKDTPLERAPEDYRAAVHEFSGLADYLVINVSSPNTPGLRSLQTVEALRPIVESVSREIANWDRTPPLLLKLAPELGESELSVIIPQAESWGIQGWVLTNTLAGKWVGAKTLEGGWSGGILTDHARRTLQLARSLTQKPIISVGGILTVEEAQARIALGADLVQIYSGWIYSGPQFPSACARALEST